MPKHRLVTVFTILAVILSLSLLYTETANADDTRQKLLLNYSDGTVHNIANLGYEGDMYTPERFEDFAMFSGPPAKKRFGGWNISAGDVRFVSAEQIELGYKFALPRVNDEDTATLTFTAVFVDDTYTVRFSCPDGTADIPASQTVFNGEKATKPAVMPTRNGYKFDGWYADSSLTEEFDFASVSIKKDITVHSAWTANVSVASFNKAKSESGSGGTVSIDGAATSEKDVRTASSVTLNAEPESGYKFAGWARDSQDGDIVSTDAEYSFDVSAAASFVAVFEGASLTVRWSSIDGVDKQDPIAIGNIVPGTKISQALEDAGKDFDGTMFSFDGYRDSGIRMLESMDKYGDYEALAKAAVSGELTIDDDTVIYCAMLKDQAMSNLQLALTVPLCGEKTTVPKNEDGSYDMDRQTNPPIVKVLEDAELTVAKARWLTSSENVAKPYTGTFVGDKEYFASVKLVMDYGFYPAFGKADVAISGAEIVNAFPDDDGQLIVVKTVAEHVPGGAVHENKVSASCEDGGSFDEVVRCSSCGDILSSSHVTVDALGHDWSDWSVVKKATSEAAGIEERMCSRCGEQESCEIAKLAVDESKDSSTAKTMPSTGDQFGGVLVVVVVLVAVAAGIGLAIAAWRRRR